MAHEIQGNVGERDVLFQNRRVPAPLGQPVAEHEPVVTQTQEILHQRGVRSAVERGHLGRVGGGRRRRSEPRTPRLDAHAARHAIELRVPVRLVVSGIEERANVGRRRRRDRRRRHHPECSPPPLAARTHRARSGARSRRPRRARYLRARMARPWAAARTPPTTAIGRRTPMSRRQPSLKARDAMDVTRRRASPARCAWPHTRTPHRGPTLRRCAPAAARRGAPG